MPSRRLFFLLGLVTLVVAAGTLVPWLVGLGLGADMVLLVLLWLDHRAAASSRLQAERTWPPLLVQGGKALVTVTLTSTAGRPVGVVLREGLHPALAERPLRRRAVIPATGTLRWLYSLSPRRRGEHTILPLTARILGPLGLAWAQRQLLDEEQQRIYPQVRWSGKVGHLLMLAHRHELGQMQLEQQGAGKEPYSLREYLPGDPVSKIHWKATARHGRPICREEVLERGARLVILLDCARAMTSFDGQRSKLDHALAAALALARVAAARGDRVTIAAFAESLLRVVRVRGGSGMSRAYRALYDQQASLSEPAYDVAVEAVSTLESRRSTVILLTSVIDLAAAELLKESLLHLERRHRPILINLEDPELRQLAHSAPQSPEEAFAKVSSLQILLENRKLAGHMRRSGIRVVTAPANRLALETLEAYLSMFKPRGSR